MALNPNSNIWEAARFYLGRGWQIIPLDPNSKGCEIPNWQKLVFKTDDFETDNNIGIRSQHGLVDVDCDAPEVVKSCAAFLPHTGAVYGRNRQPKHWLYKSQIDKTLVYRDFAAKDKDKATLIEIRVNHQSMAPPSVHNGDKILWVSDPIGDAEHIDPVELTHGVRLAATCGMFIRYYNPPGNRHDWGLYLSGLFRYLGISEQEAIKLFTEAARIVGDTEVKDRLGTVHGTYNRGDDEHLKSTSGLKETMENAEGFIKSLKHIWEAKDIVFLRDEKERLIANNQENIKRALDRLEIKLSFDQFVQRPHVKYNGFQGPLEDRIRNKIWLDIDREFHFRPQPDFFDVVVQDMADRNPIHPVIDYLKSLQWDGIPRIDTWLIRHARGADTEFVHTVSGIVLIAAVRRVMDPGCKFDEILVLESDQGYEKSTALRALCPNEDWFSDDLPLNVDSKQIIERTNGKWIIEAGELSGMRKSQREHLKSMLSRQEDGPVRMAYARLPVCQKRQFIIVGTTNDHHYLQDPTGNRRIWPVRVDRFDIPAIRRERDQMWAEAVQREASGQSIRLPQHLWEHASLQQERRRVGDSWEDKISELFPADEGEPVRLSPDEIWMHLGIPIERRTEVHQQRVNVIMQRFHFRTMAIRDKNNSGRVVRGWGRGSKKPAHRATDVELPMEEPTQEDSAENETF